MRITYWLKLAGAVLVWVAQPVTATELLIQNVTVVSAEREQPLAQASVHIRDDRVVTVSEQPLVVEGDSVTVIDAAGQFLIPGLTDSHLHTTVIPGLGFSGYGFAAAKPELAAAYERQLPRSLLYFGVTQLLDPAAMPAALARLQAEPQRPDVFHCGAAPAAGGYPLMFLAGAVRYEDFPYLIDDSDAGGRPLPAGLDPAEHTPEAVVRRIHKDGAICVKLFIEDGFGPRSDWPVLSDQTIARVQAEARQLGLKVVAHANALDMQQRAVAAGVDVLGHGLWNWGQQHRRAEGLPDEIEQHLQQIIDQNIAFQPTLRVLDGGQAMFKADTLTQSVLTKIVPPTLLAWYRSDAGQWFKQEMINDEFDGLPDAKVATILNGPISRGERAVRYLAEQNYPLLLASDYPANPGYGNQPGLSSYQELQHMARIGVPLPALFAAATLNNAKTFGLDDRYGTIEPGKIANLLLLSANPLEDVSAYQAIETVILHGQPIERESLVVDQSNQ